MGNWKTTLGGILGALSIPLAANPPTMIYGIALGSIASLWFGYHSKDK